MTKTFRDLGVHPALCDQLETRGITHPFPIQELTLPLALDGHDLIGQARTGTGKTLAFGLPLLQRIDPSRDVTQALVVVPTRELCLQVYEDLRIGTALGIRSISVYGGVGYDEQIDALTSGVHVVVGTPGRLLDHLNRGTLRLAEVTELVLDEADEMLDMGFLPDVERLIEACKGEGRHTMLFSATMPTEIVKLARRYMDHPTFTRADHEERHTAPLVTQHFFQVHRMDKPRVLARILQTPNRGGVFVFVRTKHMADRLVAELDELGTPAVPVHGDLRQATRERNLDRFRSGRATVLVATEVAARGLDVSGVTHVVNYDCPDDEKMYLHRIGRTARAGEAGVAITFAEFNEADRLNVIRKAVGAADGEVLAVFSTSEELTRLFDLPAETPWASFSRAPAEARPRRSADAEPGARADARSSSRGARRDTGRPRGDGAEPARDERPRSARPTRADAPDTPAVRTRARSRVRGDSDEAPVHDAERAPARTPDAGRTEPSRGRPDREVGDGRRADSGRRGRDAGTGEAAAPPQRRARRRPATDAGASRDDAQARDQARARDADAEPTTSSSRPDGARERNARPQGGAGRQRDRRASTRRDAADHERTEPRGDRSPTRASARRGRNARDQRDVRDEGPRTLEKRGRQARGEGSPQLARRVRVEHLP